MTAIAMNNVVAVGARQVQEPLFRSAHEALTFALNYSMQQYDRPLMNRAMSAKSSGGGEGKGLSGLDGAGQAGMIRAELEKLVPLHQAVLVASVAPAQLPCECRVSCCSGWKVNPEWQEAMSALSIAAASGALSGCLSNGRLRSDLIQKLFGADVSLTALVARYDVDKNTVGAHHLKLRRWLFSDRGLHRLAYQALTDRLAQCRLIESSAVDE